MDAELQMFDQCIHVYQCCFLFPCCASAACKNTQQQNVTDDVRFHFTCYCKSQRLANPHGELHCTIDAWYNKI
eukprot:1782698-Pleurochrysis_carterae.AAC.1